MAKSSYVPEDYSSEVQAPWGYYQALSEDFVDFRGRRVLYTRGSACIEASCCGKGSWEYLRVEGYLIEDEESHDHAPDDVHGASDRRSVDVDSIEEPEEKAALTKLLLEKHPGVRIEFR
jgi:hypothetical protein